MRYGFLSRSGVEYRSDDCDLSRFKFWFSLVHRDLSCGWVELDNGEQWVYYWEKYRRDPVAKKVWSKIK